MNTRGYLVGVGFAALGAGAAVLALKLGAAPPVLEDGHIDSTDPQVCGALQAIERRLETQGGYPLVSHDVLTDAEVYTYHAADIRMHPTQPGRCRARFRAQDEREIRKMMTACAGKNTPICTRINALPARVAVEPDPSWADTPVLDAAPPDDFDGATP